MKRMIVALLLAIFIVGCSSGAQTTDNTPTEFSLPENQKYILNSEKSQMIWHAARFVGNSHVGTIKISAGELEREDNKFTSGKFIIDMNSITEEKNSERFLTHIRSDDFFSVEEFPTSQLVLTKIEEAGENKFTVTGDLTILNQTHEITFPAEITSDPLEISSAFTIDRTKWGITYGSGSFFKDLGDKVIKDDIRFGLKLVFE